jgi:hypothetical protein
VSIFTNADLQELRCDNLLIAAQSLFPNIQITDALLARSLYAAEAEIGRRLKIFLEPTMVFGFTPAQSDIDALPAGMPWVEEPAYDYDAGFFQENRWGYVVLRWHPVISVTSMSFNYPAPTVTVFEIPNDWIRLDKQFGHIRLVPATSQFTAPLGVFLLQALGGGGTIPNMIQVDYVSGLTNAKVNWPDIIDVIYKLCIMKIIEGLFLPQSGSISADGMSMSRSLDTSKYRDLINETLMGPKGSNGGLWTAIHGFGGSVFGPTN